MTTAEGARVVCAQVAPEIGDPGRNREIATEAIKQAREAGGQIIVLPELMTSGYFLEPGEARDAAELPTGASVSAWMRALAGSDAIVIGGFCELGEGGQIHNSAAVVNADGVMAVYRKAHLWDAEPALFTPGVSPAVVVETRWGRVGIAVCYDLFFPEVLRSLAVQGACLLAVPTNSAAATSKAEGSAPDREAIGHAVARSGAYLNRVYIAVCDRYGDERGHSWNSRSSIIDLEGQFLAGPVPYERTLLVADCNLSMALNKQWDGTRNDALGDRRPELYTAAH